MSGAHVQGELYSAASKTKATKSSKTSLGASLRRVAESVIEDDVAIEVGLSADGDFEVTLRMLPRRGERALNASYQTTRSLAKGNLRHLAAQIRRQSA